MAAAAGILIGTIVSDVFFGPWPNDLVSPTQLKDYALSYTAEYRTLYLDYDSITAFHASPNRFFYGFNSPNAIMGLVSLSHGALITFNSSTGSSFVTNVSLLSQPIEYYLWPNMPNNPQASGVAPVLFTNGTYPLYAPVTVSKYPAVVSSGAEIWYNGTGNAFRPVGNMSITIYGSLVYLQRMILKGSNAPASWSTLQAKFDALDEFIQDGTGIFNSTTVQAIQTKYRVPLLLDLIAGRIANNTYRDNPGLFTSDFGELSKYAPSSTIQQVQNDYYASQKVQPPSFWDPVVSLIHDSFFQALVVGLVVAVVGGLIVARLSSRRG